MGKFIWRAGPRANQAHVTAKHVEDLRQLIQAARTQKSAERGEACIAVSIQLCHRTIDPHQFLEVVFVSLCFGAHLHCPELPDKKMSSTESDAFLSIENRAWRSESRHQHQQDHQRQPNRQREENARDVESRFPAGDLLHRTRPENRL